MTLRLFNALFILLVGTKLGVDAYGCCGCCHCSPCCNCCPCTNPPLLIKLPPTPPRLCCCGCCCCRPCCCNCCPCCGSGRRRRAAPSPLDKKCMKEMKKQVIACTNATRNCKRCANLPKLEQKVQKVVDSKPSSTQTTASKTKTNNKVGGSRARRQTEMLAQQILGNNMHSLSNQQPMFFNQQKFINSPMMDCNCKC